MSDEQADIVGEHADESVEEPESADKAKARQGDGAEADYEDETETEARSNDETEAEGTAAVVERVADADPEAIAAEITSLRTRVDDLELELEEAAVERDDLESRLKRKQAEFQNYKKRQKKRREQERARATEDLVQRLLEVRDNLNRALDGQPQSRARRRRGDGYQRRCGGDASAARRRARGRERRTDRAGARDGSRPTAARGVVTGRKRPAGGDGRCGSQTWVRDGRESASSGAGNRQRRELTDSRKPMLQRTG